MPCGGFTIQWPDPPIRMKWSTEGATFAEEEGEDLVQLAADIVVVLRRTVEGPLLARVLGISTLSLEQAGLRGGRSFILGSLQVLKPSLRISMRVLLSQLMLGIATEQAISFEETLLGTQITPVWEFSPIDTRNCLTVRSGCCNDVPLVK